jgi:hypothetical protein
VLTSQADITAAQNGFVSVQKTPIIVECSVVFTLRGGLLPLATVREDRAEEADRRKVGSPKLRGVIDDNLKKW